MILNLINNLKILLANRTTSLLHGKNESKKVESAAFKIFKDNSSKEGLYIKVNMI